MNKKIRITIAALLIVAIAVLLFFTTRQSPQVSQAKLKVTATYYPLEEFAKAVGGSKVTVTNITPAGSEPHEYEPTPKQLIAAGQSKLFIYNGAHLEPWANNFLKDYKGVAIKASQGIALKTISSNTKDPHFWLDPILAERVIDNILHTYIKIQPENAQYFRVQADHYKAQLRQLDSSYKSGLAYCQQNTIVTSHAAFGYVATRYGFSVESIAGLSPEEEPSPAKLAQLSQLVKEKNIHYIFFESLVSPRLADTIARETGAQTTVFDPIEGVSREDQRKGRTYLTIQRDNLKALQRALACQQ